MTPEPDYKALWEELKDTLKCKVKIFKEEGMDNLKDENLLSASYAFEDSVRSESMLLLMEVLEKKEKMK